MHLNICHFVEDVDTIILTHDLRPVTRLVSKKDSHYDNKDNNLQYISENKKVSPVFREIIYKAWKEHQLKTHDSWIVIRSTLDYERFPGHRKVH